MSDGNTDTVFISTPALPFFIPFNIYVKVQLFKEGSPGGTKMYWNRSSIGIALCVIFMILVSLENVKKYALCCCTITSKTKINVFWNFFSLRWSLRRRSVRKNFKKRLRQTVHCPAKMRSKLWKSHIVAVPTYQVSADHYNVPVHWVVFICIPLHLAQWGFA